jgi:hypothetical protein
MMQGQLLVSNGFAKKREKTVRKVRAREGHDLRLAILVEIKAAHGCCRM